MREIRFHGRGGQGVVIACRLLATAVAEEGKYVQAFPYFGGERRGAPVRAFTRISDRPILIRSGVYRPDHVVVLDASLLRMEDITAGLAKEGRILINSDLPPTHFSSLGAARIATVDANRIALKYGLGSKNAPIVNTSILGAFARTSGMVRLESILASLSGYVPAKIREPNERAVMEAFENVLFSENEDA